MYHLLLSSAFFLFPFSPLLAPFVPLLFFTYLPSILFLLISLFLAFLFVIISPFPPPSLSRLSFKRDPFRHLPSLLSSLHSLFYDHPPFTALLAATALLLSTHPSLHRIHHFSLLAFTPIFAFTNTHHLHFPSRLIPHTRHCWCPSSISPHNTTTTQHQCHKVRTTSTNNYTHTLTLALITSLRFYSWKKVEAYKSEKQSNRIAGLSLFLRLVRSIQAQIHKQPGRSKQLDSNDFVFLSCCVFLLYQHNTRLFLSPPICSKTTKATTSNKNNYKWDAIFCVCCLWRTRWTIKPRLWPASFAVVFECTTKFFIHSTKQNFISRKEKITTLPALFTPVRFCQH